MQMRSSNMANVKYGVSHLLLALVTLSMGLQLLPFGCANEQSYDGMVKSHDGVDENSDLLEDGAPYDAFDDLAQIAYDKQFTILAKKDNDRNRNKRPKKKFNMDDDDSDDYDNNDNNRGDDLDNDDIAHEFTKDPPKPKIFEKRRKHILNCLKVRLTLPHDIPLQKLPNEFVRKCDKLRLLLESISSQVNEASLGNGPSGVPPSSRVIGSDGGAGGFNAKSFGHNPVLRNDVAFARWLKRIKEKRKAIENMNWENENPPFGPYDKEKFLAWLKEVKGRKFQKKQSDDDDDDEADRKAFADWVKKMKKEKEKRDRMMNLATEDDIIRYNRGINTDEDYGRQGRFFNWLKLVKEAFNMDRSEVLGNNYKPPHDERAIADWIKEIKDKEKGKEKEREKSNKSAGNRGDVSRIRNSEEPDENSPEQVKCRQDMTKIFTSLPEKSGVLKRLCKSVGKMIPLLAERLKQATTDIEKTKAFCEVTMGTMAKSLPSMVRGMFAKACDYIQKDKGDKIQETPANGNNGELSPPKIEQKQSPRLSNLFSRIRNGPASNQLSFRSPEYDESSISTSMRGVKICDHIELILDNMMMPDFIVNPILAVCVSLETGVNEILDQP